MPLRMSPPDNSTILSSTLAKSTGRISIDQFESLCTTKSLVTNKSWRVIIYCFYCGEMKCDVVCRFVYMYAYTQNKMGHHHNNKVWVGILIINIVKGLHLIRTRDSFFIANKLKPRQHSFVGKRFESKFSTTGCQRLNNPESFQDKTRVTK